MVDNRLKKMHANASKPSILVGATPLELRTSPITLIALWQVVELRRQIQAEAVRLVQAARSNDVPWSDIGAALGVSAQAAQQRYAGRPRDRYADGSQNL